jgi:hypothetical protein
LALTFTSSKSEAMSDAVQRGTRVIALANAHEFNGERHVSVVTGVEVIAASSNRAR